MKESSPGAAGRGRTYNSIHRQEAARQTRLAIAAAARKLFEQRGYAGATIEAIAREAGVAKETVYASFRNKRAILAFVFGFAVTGDDQPLPLMERPHVQSNMRETDQHRQLVVFAGHIAEIMARAASIFEITRIAAKTEPEIARRIKRVYSHRLENMQRFAQALASNGPLRPGLDPAAAGEIIWGLSSPELYQLMTGYGGWSQERYAAWLADTLERSLLP